MRAWIWVSPFLREDAVYVPFLHFTSLLLFLGCGEQFLLECQFPSEDGVPDSGKGSEVAAGIQRYGLLPGRPVSVSTLLCRAVAHRELMCLLLGSIGCTYVGVLLSHRKEGNLKLSLCKQLCRTQFLFFLCVCTCVSMCVEVKG